MELRNMFVNGYIPLCHLKIGLHFRIFAIMGFPLQGSFPFRISVTPKNSIKKKSCEDNKEITRSEEFHFSDSLNILREMRFNPREVRLNQILEISRSLKIPI